MMLRLTGSRLKGLLRLMAILALIFSFVTFNAFPGDSLMYHLPFSIRFWHLDSWPDFTGYFDDRYQGFAMLWRILLGPGLFFKQPHFFFLPNLFALVGLCWCARKYLYLSWPSTVLACLCFPVSLFGFSSSMQDFFMNCTALSGALAVFSANLQTSPFDTRRAWLIGLAMLALCANVKIQGFLLAITILFLAILFSFPGFPSLAAWRPPPELLSLPRRGKKNLVYLVTLFLLVKLIFAQPIANLYRFQSPFYPIAFWRFKGAESSSISAIPYLPRLPLLYNGLSFFSSSLEIDPILRSSRGFLFKRSVHMQNPPESDRQPADAFGNRWVITGGSNGLLYALILAGAVGTLLHNRRFRSRDLDPRDRVLVAMHYRLMSCFLITLFLPQTLELRYYLFNLFVPCFVAVSSTSTPLRRWMRLATVVGTAFVLLSAILVPLYFWMRTTIWLQDGISWDVFRERPSVRECTEYVRQYHDERFKVGRISIVTAKAVVLCGFSNPSQLSSGM